MGWGIPVDTRASGEKTTLIHYTQKVVCGYNLSTSTSSGHTTEGAEAQTPKPRCASIQCTVAFHTPDRGQP